MKSWNELSMAEKADIMKLAVEGGVYDLDSIRSGYNEYAKGGKKSQSTWTMEDEAKYREWRSSLPDNLRNTDDTIYDMRGAYKAGMKPALESDGKYHLQSRDPETGRILKSPMHPTYLQAIATDASMGYYPVVDNQGNTYTQTWEGNQFKSGGGIHIKPSHRGRLTELKARTGKSEAELYNDGNPAHKKMVVFARNARKWKHGNGGNLYGGESEETQRMQKGHAIYLNYPNAEGGLAGAVRIGGIDVGAALGKVTGITSAPWGHAGVIMVDDKGNSDYYDFGRYKAGSDEYGVSTFGAIKKGKGNWRTKKLPKQKQGENDSVYVARIQNGLPDTKFGAYQALSFPNIDIEKAKAHVVKQANDANRRAYGIGNTCVDAAYKSIVPFLQDPDVAEKVVNTSPEEYNTEGYSPFASFWSMFPGTVGYTSAAMRKIADKTYIMNKKK